ncbi:hypothetical protein ACFYKX_25435 [Cytobacillus sp. FJAT-54145]|uniref:Uncharacterized protein n=1 Tax=Cytobacillus spartinae TaxID=3299023 RepID=A0ABW6KI35_9BACI
MNEKHIVFSENNDRAYGKEKDFNNADEFEKTVQEQHPEEFCLIENIRIEACISTLEGISSETLIPLSNTDIQIENYFVAEISEIGIAGVEKL